jgi:NAD(P)-dependent dehydrogenase (short-subunit alcohol dehydrogenase family)
LTAVKGKAVIITGGSSGIGRALAEEFGRNGCKVMITGRNKEHVDEAVNDLRAQGIEAFGFPSDVSSEEDCRRMADEAVRLFGRIDILINNAGITMRSLFEEVDLAVIRKVMDINFFGAVYATKYCLPEIIKTRGSVVGISSVAGFRGLPGRSGYSASKFALNGFLEALRTEHLKSGVHVLTACPGFTASNIRKSALSKNGTVQGESPRDEGRMMSAEEAARRIYQATLHRKKYIIMTPEGRITVFLNKWLHSLTDRLVYETLAREKDSPFK